MAVAIECGAAPSKLVGGRRRPTTPEVNSGPVPHCRRLQFIPAAARRSRNADAASGGLSPKDVAGLALLVSCQKLLDGR